MYLWSSNYVKYELFPPLTAVWFYILCNFTNKLLEEIVSLNQESLRYVKAVWVSHQIL